MSLPCSIELDTLERSLGDDGGSSGPVEDQGDLAEVIRRAEAADFDGILVVVASLRHLRRN